MGIAGLPPSPPRGRKLKNTSYALYTSSSGWGTELKQAVQHILAAVWLQGSFEFYGSYQTCLPGETQNRWHEGVFNRLNTN